MKIATDLEQSRKLAEILTVDSADMYYINGDTDKIIIRKWKNDMHDDDDIPCWSLAALLDVLPDEITTKDGYEYNLRIVKDGVRYFLFYEDSCGEKEDIDTDYHDDLVDAVYELILKLKDMDLI